MEHETDNIIYLPNGELNAPYLLANANLLLKEGDPQLASSLFLLTTKTKNYAHCGFYGLGQCYRHLQKPDLALDALRKAFALSRRAYIAIALIQALLECGQFQEAEQTSLSCAVEFLNDTYASEQIRGFYQKAIQSQVSTSK